MAVETKEEEIKKYLEETYPLYSLCEVLQEFIEYAKRCSCKQQVKSWWFKKNISK